MLRPAGTVAEIFQRIPEKLWDQATGQSWCTLTGHSEWVRSVASSPDSQLLASTGNAETVRLWH